MHGGTNDLCVEEFSAGESSATRTKVICIRIGPRKSARVRRKPGENVGGRMACDTRVCRHQFRKLPTGRPVLIGLLCADVGETVKQPHWAYFAPWPRSISDSGLVSFGI